MVVGAGVVRRQGFWDEVSEQLVLLRDASLPVLRRAVGSVYRKGQGVTKNIQNELVGLGVGLERATWKDLKFLVQRVVEQLSDCKKNYFPRQDATDLGAFILSDASGHGVLEPVLPPRAGYEVDIGRCKESVFKTIETTVEAIEEILGFGIDVEWCDGRWPIYTTPPSHRFDYTGTPDPPRLTGAWEEDRLPGVPQEVYDRLNIYLDENWPEGQVGISVGKAATRIAPFGYEFSSNHANDVRMRTCARCPHERLDVCRNNMDGFFEIEAAALAYVQSKVGGGNTATISTSDAHFLKQPPSWSPHRDQHVTARPLVWSLILKLSTRRERVGTARRTTQDYSGLQVLEPAGLRRMSFGPGDGSCKLIRSQVLHRSIPMKDDSDEVRKITFFYYINQVHSEAPPRSPAPPSVASTPPSRKSTRSSVQLD